MMMMMIIIMMMIMIKGQRLKLKVEFAAVFLQLFDGIPIKNFAV